MIDFDLFWNFLLVLYPKHASQYGNQSLCKQYNSKPDDRPEQKLFALRYLCRVPASGYEHESSDNNHDGRYRKRDRKDEVDDSVYEIGQCAGRQWICNAHGVRRTW